MINEEVREQTCNKLDKIDAEVGQLQEQFNKAEDLQEILKK